MYRLLGKLLRVWRVRRRDGVADCVATQEQVQPQKRAVPPWAYKQRARLNGAKLQDANLMYARLQGIDLWGARLDRAYLDEAQLQRADLHDAGLQGAHLRRAQLQDADLHEAQLQGAALLSIQAQGANLTYAHLEGANLSHAHMEGARFIGTFFDKATAFNDAKLARASLDRATFDNTNLSVVDWKQVPILGDEVTAQNPKEPNGKRKELLQRIADYEAAVRAYRRLAVALQANGLSTEAANYLYRASIMERRLAYRERRFGAYFFSVLLAVLAGYGYRLGRIVVAYLSVVLFFAALFLGARYFTGGTIDGPQVADALQISLNAIHGRVFFAQFGLDTAQSWIATIESVVGIVIEGVFVAMLIQRFFGK